MITCITIDDEPLALKQLETYVKKTPFLQLAGSFHSATEASAHLAENPVDVIFTDINMPDCSGMQFVKDLENPPLIVFSTAYEEYAVESFRIDAIDYLLKPYSYQDFLKAALKVKQYHEWKSMDPNVTGPAPENDFFFIRADNQSVKIFTEDILYIEAMSEYIRIHFKKAKSLMTFMSIKLMMETLPSSRFMRVHRSYIISLDSIKSFHRNEVELNNGQTIPVSATYKDALQKYIETQTVTRKTN